MSDAPVTKLDCEKHSDTVQLKLDNLFAILEKKVSWRYYTVTCAAVGLMFLLMINWQIRNEDKFLAAVKEHSKISTIEKTVEYIRAEQINVQEKQERIYKTVTRLEVLIKKNGNH